MDINLINGEKAKTREELRMMIKEMFRIDVEMLERITDEAFNKVERDPYQDYIDYIADQGDALEQY